jgi:anti-sigma B factor antagonist
MRRIMTSDPAVDSQFPVRFPASGIAIIDIRGELKADSSDDLAGAYSLAATQRVTTIILSFRGLEYMNSSGIGLIVTLLVRARRNGQRVLATELSAHYRQIFEVTRLVEAINVFESEAEALRLASSVRAD